MAIDSENDVNCELESVVVVKGANGLQTKLYRMIMYEIKICGWIIAIETRVTRVKCVRGLI